MASSNTLFPGVRSWSRGAAGSGIGDATAHAFAGQQVARVSPSLTSTPKLSKAPKSPSRKSTPSPRSSPWPATSARPQFVDDFIVQVVQKFGRLDYCVNCAGRPRTRKNTTTTSIDEFDRVNAVNYRGCWLTSRAQLKTMVGQDTLASHDGLRPAQRGAIVNIASQLGIVGRPNASAYCASKAAVIGLTRSDAIDYSAHGIRVNCICPGVIETPFIMTKKEDKEAILPFANIAPMKRMGQPYEVADAALFLCSTKASFVQGHAMTVDGGYVIN
ncbi:oxidoreductase [Phyllosticta citriasiana]|uniref:oxidoreductase n=1 Tax=Phyllosticta citriasiana TaxID=595635 RepID=UPI0030FD6E8E